LPADATDRLTAIKVKSNKALTIGRRRDLLASPTSAPPSPDFKNGMYRFRFRHTVKTR